VPLAAWPAYDLTTLRQPANRMVSLTIDTLLKKIDCPEFEPQQVRIDGPLILRSSARVPQGWTAGRPDTDLEGPRP